MKDSTGARTASGRAFATHGRLEPRYFNHAVDLYNLQLFRVRKGTARASNVTSVEEYFRQLHSTALTALRTIDASQKCACEQ